MIKPIEVKVEVQSGCDLLEKALLLGPPRILVTPIWDDVDRPNVGGIAIPDNVRGHQLAERLRRAMLSGAAFSSTEVKTDINGKTYVETVSRVMGRHLNADLTRIGY